MTSCLKLMRVFGTYGRANDEHFCSPCVYFSGNLDPAEYPLFAEPRASCGLGFLPGDNCCGEMRTDNCSAGRSG